MASIPPLPPISSAAEFQAPSLAPDMGMGMGLGDFEKTLEPIRIQEQPKRAIDDLRPGSEKHNKVLEKLRAMYKFGMDEMRKHHHRWNWMEQKLQAYINLPDYEQYMNELSNNQGAPPEPVKVIVPYSYATIHAACTYLSTVLLGRKPIFPLLSAMNTTVDKARYMEQALQMNMEYSRAYEVLWQYLWDSLTYSFGATRMGWTDEHGPSLQIVNGQRQMVQGVKYSGNRLINVDPYTLSADPRVPLHQCNKKGDFMFWETPQSKMELYNMEYNGDLKWVKEACKKDQREYGTATHLPAVSDSRRRARIGTAGEFVHTPSNVSGFALCREGTARIIPDDWGLSDKKEPELWKFMWVNDAQIVQAEPFGAAHNRHPMSITEPTTMGYEFGSISMNDMLGPFQDIMSWLVNSRIENVRTTINNMFIADPGRVEMQDLRSPAPGRIIRLKRMAIGTPIDEAIKQLVVMDNTQGHFNDISLLRMLADSITGVNDNLRGIQPQGGRRSATEARMSMQAGASRLSQMAVRISSQGLLDIAEQGISNIQQYCPEEMWVQMSGDSEAPSTLLTPDMITGSFNYQISDGSLPYDKIALLEVWKEILFGVAKDPELRQQYDLGEIFEYVSILGGAKNIKNFEKQQPQVMAPGQEPPPGAVPMGMATPAAPAGMNPFAGGM